MKDPKAAELHLGILQNRAHNLKQEMNVCMLKVDMEDPKEKGIDVESENLKFEALNKKFKLVEQRITNYEDKILTSTEL